MYNRHGPVESFGKENLIGTPQSRVEIDLDALGSKLGTDRLLFSESSGFLVEITPERAKEAEAVCRKHGADLVRVGSCSGDGLAIRRDGKAVINLPAEKLGKSWTSGFPEAMR